MNTMFLPFAGAAVVAGLVVPGAAHALAPAAVRAAAGASSATPECTAGDLAASFRATGAGMSHVFGVIRLRNISAGDCVVQGYGGLSFVGGGNGTQVGRAAARTPSRTPRVVLKPGQKAVSGVEMTTTGPYAPKTCQAAKVDGFRVYPPDSTTALFAPHKTTVCSNRRLTILWHKAYRAA